MRTRLIRAASWLPFAFAGALHAQTSGLAAPMSGDCTSSATGNVICGKTNGAGFAASATTDTTNAANITAGTLGGARLPVIPLANSQPLVMDTAGLLALYRFDETGGNLVDASGNGNHGVVGTAPVRNGSSYQFTASNQAVTLPTALNAANTFYFVVTAPPTPGGQSIYGGANNNISTVLSSNGGTTGSMRINTNALQAGPMYPTTGLPGTYTLNLGAASGFTYMTTGDIWSGTHVVALSCPSSGNGQFYLDGVALTTLGGSFNCYNVQQGGSSNYLFGSSTQGFWPEGISYWAAAFYSTSDGAAAIAKRSLALKQYSMAKGAPFAGQATVPSMAAKLIGQGDSILCGYYVDGKCTTGGAGASTTSSFLNLATALLNKPYTSVNYGVPSATVQDNLAAAPVLVDTQALGLVGQNFFVEQAGTNNLNFAAATVSQIWSLLAAQAAGRAQAGLRPVLVGLVSRGGANCLGSTNCDAAVQSVNAAERREWKNSRYAGFVDLGSDPLLGATGAYANPNGSGCTNSSTTGNCYFAADGLHPIVQGHARMAQALACVLNGMDGSNAGNMDPAAITAASTTLGCGDGGRYLDPTANPVNATLWSAMWQTGREIAFCNVSSSTGNTATLTAPADFPFSSVTGRTTLTVAPGSCVKLRAVFNGNASAPGNFWMQQ